MRTSTLLCTLSLVAIISCDREPDAVPQAADPTPEAKTQPESGNEAPEARITLTDARKGFVTKLVEPGPQEEAAAVPPEGSGFEMVHYSSPAGELGAYLTTDPGDGKKHPAIVWLTGGDTNSIGPVWEPRPLNNDQSASQFREAGIVMLFPSQRGGNTFPGRREGFLGEVDDVLAATKFLRSHPYVDPDRIYLGGHSTGGTLALLVAESTDTFRTTFAFGPVHDPRGYGGDFRYHDTSREKEADLRAPIRWLEDIRTPVFVIEGQDGNVGSLFAMKGSTENPKVSFIPLSRTDHFSVLGPVNAVIARQILADTAAEPRFDLSEATLQPLFAE